jgi:hypothetical protein
MYSKKGIIAIRGQQQFGMHPDRIEKPDSLNIVEFNPLSEPLIQRKSRPITETLEKF